MGNGLENYCFSLRNSLNEEKLKDKIPADDKTKIDSMIEDALKWLDDNQEAEAEVYQEKQKEIEGVANPVLHAAYGAAGGAPGGMPGGMPGADPATGPQVEE